MHPNIKAKSNGRKIQQYVYSQISKDHCVNTHTLHSQGML